MLLGECTLYALAGVGVRFRTKTSTTFLVLSVAHNLITKSFLACCAEMFWGKRISFLPRWCFTLLDLKNDVANNR